MKERVESPGDDTGFYLGICPLAETGLDRGASGLWGSARMKHPAMMYSFAVPEDPTKWIDAIQRLLHFVFGERIPTPITRALGWALLLALVLLAIWGLLFLLSKIWDLWKGHFQPIFYDSEERRKRELRRRFADHIDSEIRRLSSFEQWSDHRFAELEAEVESEGLRSGLLPFIKHRQGIRRERTLSRALRNLSTILRHLRA